MSIKESDIGGCEITFGIRFCGDAGLYTTEVRALLDELEDAINNCGHVYIYEDSKPLSHEEVRF